MMRMSVSVNTVVPSTSPFSHRLITSDVCDTYQYIGISQYRYRLFKVGFGTDGSWLGSVSGNVIEVLT